MVMVLLARGDGIDRKLKTLIGILLRPRSTALVIDDCDPSIAQTIDAIDSPDHSRLSYLDLKGLLSVHHIRKPIPLTGFEKDTELRDSLPSVQIVLLFLRDAALPQQSAEHFNDVLPGEGALGANGIV